MYYKCCIYGCIYSTLSFDYSYPLICESKLAKKKLIKKSNKVKKLNVLNKNMILLSKKINIMTKSLRSISQNFTHLMSCQTEAFISLVKIKD